MTKFTGHLQHRIERRQAWSRAKGHDMKSAILRLRAGESVRLPTHSGAACSLIQYLRKSGLAQQGEFTVRGEGDCARVYRLELGEPK